MNLRELANDTAYRTSPVERLVFAGLVVFFVVAVCLTIGAT